MILNKNLIFVILVSIFTYGSTGEPVKTIQDKLKRWGYYSGSIDGSFGYTTSEALKKFQKKYNLKVTGIADVETLELLGIYKTEQEIKNNNSLNNQSDLFLLAKAIDVYAKNEPYIGKVAFSSVVLNRVNSPYFPNTIYDVLYQDNIELNLHANPSETSIKAAKDALWGFDPSNGALYRWETKNIKNNMIGKLITIVIGKYNFGV